MFSEKVELVLIKRKMTQTALAEKLGTSVQSLNSRLKKDNFSEEKMRQLAEILDCDVNITMTLRDTKETF